MRVFKPALVIWIIALVFLFSFSTQALLAESNFGRLPLSPYLDGTLIKGSGPEVYVIKSGKKTHIPDPETFKAMGYKRDHIKNVSDKELNATSTNYSILTKSFPRQGSEQGECVKLVRKLRPDVNNTAAPTNPKGSKDYMAAFTMFENAKQKGVLQTGKVPRVGAVIVWDKIEKKLPYGHVAIIKEIKSTKEEGKIELVVADSNWSKNLDGKYRERHLIFDSNSSTVSECKILGFIYERKESYELKKRQAGELLITNVAKSVMTKRTGSEIPALSMPPVEMKTAMTTPAFLAPGIDTSTDTTQNQTTKDVENDPPWNMSGRPTSHWGFMLGMLTQDPAGSGIYGKGYDSGNNLSNLDSSNIRAFDKDGRVVTLDGTSSPPRITSLQTSTGTATGGIPVSVNMNELGHNSFMEWGYWLQNNFMQAGGANYYFENSYYVKGDYTTNAQMQALTISGKYNGNAYATYWAAPGGHLNKADMSGNFSADVNFSSKTLSNINISVSGNSHSASISGATASFTGGSSTFVGNSDGHWKIDGVTAGSGAAKKLKGSFYGPNAKAIGGLFGMNTLTTPTKYVTGAFQGSR